MLWARRASWITASLGCSAALELPEALVEVGVDAEEVSSSSGTGEPSRDRLSGVCSPLEWADRTPEWLGDAGALLQGREVRGQ